MAEVSGILILAGLVASPIIGGVIGFYISKRHQVKVNKKIEAEAKEVLEGKRENVLEIDGVKYPAEKFKVQGEDGKEKLIEFKGGVKKQDGKGETEIEQIKKEIIGKTNSIIRKDSRSIRKKKRDLRRRFG